MGQKGVQKFAPGIVLLLLLGGLSFAWRPLQEIFHEKDSLPGEGGSSSQDETSNLPGSSGLSEAVESCQGSPEL